MGIFWAAATYIFWGLTPIFWKQFKDVTSIELLAQRVVWSLLFLVPLVLRGRQRREIVQLFTSNRRKLPYVFLAAFLIGFNWYAYVLAIITNKVLQTSLGYFMTPLMSILFSIILLKERLTRLQTIAVSLAVFAAVLETVKTGQAPFLALLLSSTFAFYAYLKKKMQISAAVGLALEMSLMLPALVYFFSRHGVPHHSPSAWVMLVMIGPITVVPMVWYTWALQRVSFVTVAFLQYLSPFLTFFLAVFVYQEPFRWIQRVTFFITWVALGLFMWDLWLRTRRKRPSEIPQPQHRSAA